ncbi:MAG: TIGR00159 family protein [Epulopiscium sp. Nuni2H_MBin003]|nr:MAG: TIGR00159 family protein [Epulopiscium sp. Nuni2H_MBin003]
MEILQSTLEQIPFFSIPSLQIQDVLDISLVSYGIYKLIMWIKDTRTWAVFKGVVFIVALALMSYFFGMHTLSFIITNTLTVGTIAMIILFQPELRRALEQIGQGKLWGSVTTNEKESEAALDEASINSIARAATQMAKTKTGALIVIESTTLLSEYERTGIIIDAVISSQLLINIFEKNTPLHDGAVIICKNRITAATCFLPLSDNMSLSKDLGTRHRAAIGVTEETDAVVVVVSEETGAISYVRNGKIKRDLDAEMLTTLLGRKKKSKSSQKKMKLWKGRGQNG